MNRVLTSTNENPHAQENCKRALVISDSSETVTEIDNILTRNRIEILVTSDSKQALSLLASTHVDYVIIDLDSIDMPGDELVYTLRVRLSDNLIPIVVIAPSAYEEKLPDCLSAGCDDFLLKPFSAITLTSRLKSLDHVHDLKNLYKSTVNDQLLAKQILAFALSERNVQFEEIDLLSKSKSVFSGDLFLSAKHPDGGLHVMLADFTGHGLPAAISALPVADMFSAMTAKGFEIDVILENINNKLHTLLPVTMFMACIMLKVHNDLKHVDIWNGGMPDIYLRDTKTGEIKKNIKSLHIALGITESSDSNYVPETIVTRPNDELIIYSDGLTEAENFEGDMFGDDGLEDCIESNKNETSIFNAIVANFNKHCNGNNPDDDVTLACIPCACNLTEVVGDNAIDSINNINDDWCWYLELSGSSLHNVNPVPIVMNEAYKVFGQSVNEEKLSSVLVALYDNAITHGLSDLRDKKKTGADSDEYLHIGLKKVVYEGEDAILISLEDSGEGFDYKGLLDKVNVQSGNDEIVNNGIALVNDIVDSLHYHGRGNLVEAIINVQA